MRLRLSVADVGPYEATRLHTSQRAFATAELPNATCAVWPATCKSRSHDHGPSHPEMRQLRGVETRRPCDRARTGGAMRVVQRRRMAEPPRAASAGPRCSLRGPDRVRTAARRAPHR